MKYAEALLKINHRRIVNKDGGVKTMQNRYCMFFGECPNVTFEDDANGNFMTGSYQLPVTITANDPQTNTQKVLTNDMFAKCVDISDYDSKSRQMRALCRSQIKDNPEMFCFVRPSSRSCVKDKQFLYNIDSQVRDGWLSTCIPGDRQSCMNASKDKLTLRDVLDSIKQYHNYKVRPDFAAPAAATDEEMIRNRDNFFNHFHIFVVSACTCGLDQTQFPNKYKLKEGLSKLYSLFCPNWIKTQLGGNFDVTPKGTYLVVNGKRKKVYLRNNTLFVRERNTIVPLHHSLLL
jgi:hypothetical protein